MNASRYIHSVGIAIPTVSSKTIYTAKKFLDPVECNSRDQKRIESCNLMRHIINDKLYN